MATHPEIVPSLNQVDSSPGTSDSGSSADNLFRQFCRYLGVAFILSFFVFLGAIVESAQVVPLWWTVAVVLAVHGAAVVMFAASFRRADVACVRWSGRVVVVGYGLAVATWPLVWNGGVIDANYGMWFTQFNGFAAVTAAVVWRVRWSLPYLIFVLVSVQFVNDAVHAPTYMTNVATDIAWSVCLCAIPYAIAVAALRSGRVLDATRAQSAQAVADAAGTVARADERARFDALTHDRVMATLLSAARHPMSDELVAQATSTLSKLEVLKAIGEADMRPLEVDDAVRKIIFNVTEVDGTIAVHTDISSRARDEMLPGPVVGTVAEAAAEAARNSIRHAGTEATRALNITVTDSELCVEVVDDGVGFDLSSVRPDRLGVSGSIHGRVEGLTGGSAEVISAPGEGTSVRMRWDRT